MSADEQDPQTENGEHEDDAIITSNSLQSFLKTVGVFFVAFLFIQFMVRTPALNGAAPLDPWDGDHAVEVTFTPIPETKLPSPPYQGLTAQDMWDFYQEANSGGDLDGAERMLQEAKNKANALGPDTPLYFPTKKEMAYFYLYKRGNYAQAINEFRYLVSALEVAHGADSPLLAPALQNLANTLATAKRFGEAEPLFKRAIEILRTATPGDKSGVAAIYKDYGHWFAVEGRIDDAMEQYEAAIDLLSSPGDRGVLKPIVDSYVVHLRANNKFERATQVEALVN